MDAAASSPLGQDGAREVYSHNAFDLYQTKKRFDLREKQNVTLERYRFVDCSALINDGTLRIWEYTSLPAYLYAAVSHVWEGASALPEDVTFSPEGTTGKAAGNIPISLRVIREACYAALKRGINRLWIDRLCIIQSDPNDITWHFTVMHNLYKQCALCLVIPAGLAQITSLSTETPWINRGWTLQESVAPRDVQVLFAWTGDECWVKAHESNTVPKYITHVTKNLTAMAPLGILLDACITGSLIILDKEAKKSTADSIDNICIFGKSPKGSGLDYTGASPSIAMLAAAISTTLEQDEDRVHHCLWKCMLMRTTRYRCDMIFSIMGLFGVILNPNDFIAPEDLNSKVQREDDSRNDCIRPAIALARALLEQKKGASWLGASFFAPPCPELSTFPSFPWFTDGGMHTPVINDGQHNVAAASLMLNEYVATVNDMPQGEMDKNGYLTFKRLAVPIVAVPSSTELEQEDSGKYLWSADGSKWQQRIGAQSDGETHSFQTMAVFLGIFYTYSPTPGLPVDLVRAMIIEKHDESRFHVVTYAMLTRPSLKWIAQWITQEFCVGGPRPLSDKYIKPKVTNEDERLPRKLPEPRTYIWKSAEHEGPVSVDDSKGAEIPTPAEESGAAAAPEGPPAAAEASTEWAELEPTAEEAEVADESYTWSEVEPTVLPISTPMYSQINEAPLPRSAALDSWEYDGPMPNPSIGSTFREKSGWQFKAEDAWTPESLLELRRIVAASSG